MSERAMQPDNDGGQLGDIKQRSQTDADPKVPQAAALFAAGLILALPWGHHVEMSLYCNGADEQLRYETDKPAIGLILRQPPNRVLAEYALRGVDTPVGVAGFALTRALPEALQSGLPRVAQIEQELGGEHE